MSAHSVAAFGARKLGWPTKLVYGLGAVAAGARDVGFNTFVLIFYNQVLGLTATLTGLALMLTLMADAVCDPLIGAASDAARTPWGRRHPFLYAATTPAAATYVLLWNPPHGLAGPGLFAWLLVVSLAARFCISLFTIPFQALVAEFTADYDERTSLLTWCYAIGWWAGLGLAVTAYAVFLGPTVTDPTGMLGRAGYGAFGLFSGLVLLIAMLVTAIGTHREIPRLVQPRPRARPALGNLAAAFANPSLVALLVSAILLAAMQGFSNGLYNYVAVFIWGLTSSQIGLLSAAPFVSVALVLALTPWIAARREKRNLAVAVAIVAVVGQPLPVILRLAGLMPANGAPTLMPILLVHSALETAVWVFAAILTASMVADLVEDHQRRTGERAEGLLFALITFTGKVVSGLGVLLTGLVLDLIGFPTGAGPGHVPAATITRLGLTYAPVFIVLGIGSALALLGYRITRSGHARTLQAIGEAAA
jgi:Na+/melibiose symporter-like transporter